jgi:hypothetical protein
MPLDLMDCIHAIREQLSLRGYNRKDSVAPSNWLGGIRDVNGCPLGNKTAALMPRTAVYDSGAKCEWMFF